MMQRVINSVGLDWDVPYSTVHNSMAWKALIRWVKNTHNVEVLLVKLRRSPYGHVHVVVVFAARSNWSFLRRLELRSMLHDDANRISADLARHARGEPVERLWDFKMKGNGQTHRAGPWLMAYSILSGWSDGKTQDEVSGE